MEAPAPAFPDDRALARESVRALDYLVERLRSRVDDPSGIDRRWYADTLDDARLTAAAYGQAFTVDPSTCPACVGKPSDYRSALGHLELDPATGATVLAPHLPKGA